MDPRGRGVLPAHVRRACARRERLRERLAAPPEDRAPGQGGRQHVDPARTGPEGRGDRYRAGTAPSRGVPEGATLKIERWSSSPPGLVSPDAKAVRIGLDAFERAMGVPPGADPHRRHPPDRPRPRRQGHPDDHHRLRASRLEHPLAQRAAVAEYVPSGSPRRASSTSASRTSDPLSELAQPPADLARRMPS